MKLSCSAGYCARHWKLPRFLAIPGESSNFLFNGPRIVTVIGRKESGSFIAKVWERLLPMWPIIGREVNHW